MEETQLFTEPLEFSGDKDQEIERVNRPDVDQSFQKPEMSAKELTKVNIFVLNFTSCVSRIRYYFL